MAERIKIGPRKKIAFVCSGGAAKAAAFHMGVSLALQEKGFSFIGGLKGNKPRAKKSPWEIDTYVGSSAGSIICAYLAAGYSVDQIFQAYLGKSKNGNSSLRPMSYGTLLSMRASLHESDEHSKSLAKRLKVFSSSAINLLYYRKLLSISGVLTTSGIESYMRNDVLPSNNFKDYQADLFIVATQLNHSKRIIFTKQERRVMVWFLLPAMVLQNLIMKLSHLL
jgi:predicted acylesterase/phospholipase RssA